MAPLQGQRRASLSVAKFSQRTFAIGPFFAVGHIGRSCRPTCCHAASTRRDCCPVRRASAQDPFAAPYRAPTSGQIVADVSEADALAHEMVMYMRELHHKGKPHRRHKETFIHTLGMLYFRVEPSLQTSVGKRIVDTRRGAEMHFHHDPLFALRQLHMVIRCIRFIALTVQKSCLHE